MMRPRADRSGTGAALLVAAAGCALVLALTGCSQSAGASAAQAAKPAPSGARSAAGPPLAGPSYALMQMNLCLSGLASCYAKVAYPAVLEEAVARIQEARPDAVTFNEACGNDVALIARRTGYQLRFSRVIYGAQPLECVHPGGRGLFGDAVLTKARIESTASRAFKAQEGIERRGWLCVITRVGVEVCTAHLNESTPAEIAGNDAQCAELRALLARRAAARTVTFGGDVNRRASCAPGGFWSRTDRFARQTPGFQQVYGTGALVSPVAEAVPAAHTDHNVLLVRTHLAARR